MKSIVIPVAVGLMAVAALVVITGCAPLGGPPLNVQIGMFNDSTVQIAWTEPSEGKPDAYLVHIRFVTDTGYTFVVETTATSYVHDPGGRTGVYRVTAKFSGHEYPSQDTTATTVPVYSDTAVLFELNADSSKSGYGWDQTTGYGSVYSMALAANASKVDFYISNLRPGKDSIPYAVVCPESAYSRDAGAVGIIPTANWRRRGFANALPLAAEQSPLLAYDPAHPNYYIYTDIQNVPTLIPCYTAGDTLKHYALIKVLSRNDTLGTVKIESWFQRVVGLRLIEHPR